MRHSPLRLSAAITTAIALALAPVAAEACTSFRLSAKDGGYVYARTLEFGTPLKSEFIIVPRDHAITGTGPNGEANGGLSWTTKHGVVGANAFQMPIVVDGTNEVGLTGGLLYLPTLTTYQTVTGDEAANSIAPQELLLYTLSSFATVAEAQEGLAKIKVSNAKLPALGGILPIHMTLHDPSGASIVVEYLNGEMLVHDNPTAVLTNAPSFPWHLSNLGNYLTLTVYDPKPMTIGSLTIAPPSTGAGAVGMPGDMSSPSRFVRAFAFSQAAPQEETSEKAADLAFHILDNFDIAPGIIRTQAGSSFGGGVAGLETTEWSAVTDMKNGRFMLRTFENSQTQAISLADADFAAAEIRTIAFAPPAPAINVLESAAAR